MNEDVSEELDREGVRGNRWARYSLWGAVALGSILLYFVVYPIPLIYLDDANGFDIESKVPEWVYHGIGITAVPLSWMMDEVPIYRTSIEWMILQVEK